MESTLSFSATGIGNSQQGALRSAPTELKYEDWQAPRFPKDAVASLTSSERGAFYHLLMDAETVTKACRDVAMT